MPTARERLAAETIAAIRHVQLTITGDALLLCEVVAGGPVHWRQRFLLSMKQALGPLCPVDESIADQLFRFFCKRVERQYGQPAKDVLDSIEVHSPPTKQEIADAWEVESESSEAGRKHFYGDDSPQTFLHKLVH